MIAQIWDVVLDIVYLYLRDHLIPNILTPYLIRLTENFGRSDYSYANSPQIKIAVNPNDTPLSPQNGYHWGFVQLFSHCVYILGQNDQMRCQNLRNNMVFKILTKVGQ